MCLHHPGPSACSHCGWRTGARGKKGDQRMPCCWRCCRIAYDLTKIVLKLSCWWDVHGVYAKGGEAGIGWPDWWWCPMPADTQGQTEQGSGHWWSCRCLCMLQRSWIRRLLRVPFSSNDFMSLASKKDVSNQFTGNNSEILKCRFHCQPQSLHKLYSFYFYQQICDSKKAKYYEFIGVSPSLWKVWSAKQERIEANPSLHKFPILLSDPFHLLFLSSKVERMEMCVRMVLHGRVDAGRRRGALWFSLPWDVADGLGLDLLILEVFSNLNGSMALWYLLNSLMSWLADMKILTCTLITFGGIKTFLM